MSAIKQDGPYDSRTLTKVFCLSSLALGGSILWMVLDDHARAWKPYQEAFRTIEVAKAKTEMDEARRAISDQIQGQLDAEMKAAETEVAAKKAEIEKAEAELKAAQTEFERAAHYFQIAKAEVDSDVYFLEHYGFGLEAEKAAHYAKKIEADEAVLHERGLAKEKASIAVDDSERGAKARIARLREAVIKAEKHRDEIYANFDRTRRKYEQIGPGFMNDYFRNKPIVDLFDRSLREKQIVLDNLKDDYFFSQVRKVDRCTTCHLAIDRKGY